MVKLRRWITSLRSPRHRQRFLDALVADIEQRRPVARTAPAGSAEVQRRRAPRRQRRRRARSPRLLPLVRGVVVAARSGGADDRLRFDLDQLGRPRETGDFHQGHRGPDVPEMRPKVHRVVRHINIGDVDARLRTTSSSDPRAASSCRARYRQWRRPASRCRSRR